MNIIYSLSENSFNTNPVILTIGTFDGIHLGHQLVLKSVSERAKKNKTKSVVITFSNHPSTVLRVNERTSLLCTTAYKIKKLEELFIDEVVLLPFTKEFSTLSAEAFLTKVQQSIPFNVLILGNDAHFGNNREGNKEKIFELSKKLHFSYQYLDDLTREGQRISSTHIRESILKGHLKEAELFLGRSFSIYEKVLKGQGRGASLGFPTANLLVDNLTIPPLGVYKVLVNYKGGLFKGIANLGRAPTLNSERSVILEVHLFNQDIDLYQEYVEVSFQQFIRPEIHFESVEALKKQIKKDMALALALT